MIGFFLFFGVYFNSHKMANIDEVPYGVLGPHASSNSEKKLNSFGSCVYVASKQRRVRTGFKEKRAAHAKFVVFHHFHLLIGLVSIGVLIAVAATVAFVVAPRIYRCA